VPVNYTTAVVNYSAGASGWLSVPPSGTAPGTLTVGVGTTNLAPGTYTATLNVVSTATRTVSIGVTYLVGSSSLTLNPSSLAFTIDSASVAAALTKSVNVGASGASLNWTAASSQPWVTVSPSSGSSGTTVSVSLVPARIDALDPGMRSATVTFSYTPPGGGPTSTPLAVSLNLLLPRVRSVTPYVATSGTRREVILRGLGFNNAAGAAVKFGSGPAVSSYTVVRDSEIRVTHPELTANSYRVSIANQLNLVRSTADLVVVDAPGYSATTIAYPNPTAKQALNIAYDAQRKALLVGVAYPSAGQSGDIFRYTFSGSAWSATPASTPVSAFRDMALSLDGTKLIAVSELSINQLDPSTLAAGTRTSAPFSPPFFLSGVALANDGNGVVTTGTQGGGSTNVYQYSVGGGSFSAPIGSLFSAVGGASADGSRALFVQGSSPPQNVFQYTASNSAFSSVGLALAQALRGPVLDRSATRIVLNGSLVYDANFQQLGKIPDSLAVVLSVNGSKAYGYSSGTQLHTYNLNSTLDTNGFFPEIGSGTTLAGDPGSNPVMTMSPDGGSLFIAGADAIVVVPAP